MIRTEYSCKELRYSKFAKFLVKYLVCLYENTYPVKLAVSVSCHCVDFLVTNFKCASHDHDTGTFEKLSRVVLK